MVDLTNYSWAQVSSTEADVSCTSSAADQPLHVAVRTAAQGGAFAKGDEEIIKTGTNCTWSGDAVSLAGVNTFLVTGLTIDVTYYVGFAQEDGVNYSWDFADGLGVLSFSRTGPAINIDIDETDDRKSFMDEIAEDVEQFFGSTLDLVEDTTNVIGFDNSGPDGIAVTSVTSELAPNIGVWSTGSRSRLTEANSSAGAHYFRTSAAKGGTAVENNRVGGVIISRPRSSATTLVPYREYINFGMWSGANGVWAVINMDDFSVHAVGKQGDSPEDPTCVVEIISEYDAIVWLIGKPGTAGGCYLSIIGNAAGTNSLLPSYTADARVICDYSYLTQYLLSNDRVGNLIPSADASNDECGPATATGTFVGMGLTSKTSGNCGQFKFSVPSGTDAVEPDTVVWSLTNGATEVHTITIVNSTTARYTTRKGATPTHIDIPLGGVIAAEGEVDIRWRQDDDGQTKAWLGSVSAGTDATATVSDVAPDTMQIGKVSSHSNIRIRASQFKVVDSALSDAVIEAW